jgi:hypothetical protein
VSGSHLRDFPPVEPVEPPSRLSMTLLRHYNDCNRSAYLYRKYRGGPASQELNRGTIAHVAFQRMLEHMRDEGESRLPMDVAKDIMAEAIAHTPITVPAEQQGKLRVMAAHFAEGVVLDPATIRGVEQKVLLEIDGLPPLVGKLDVVLSPEDGTLEIWDWKTALAMTAVEEIAEKLRDGRLAPKSFQLLIYVLLAAFGIPVETETCEACEGTGKFYSPGEVPNPDCATCEGRGSFDTPIADEPLGHGRNLFRAFEQYPMFLFDRQHGGGQELGKRGPLEVTRPELIDHRLMLEGLAFKAAAAFGMVEIPGIEPWKFEAVSGTHCKVCPARAECPIPEHLRSWAGEINTVEQASEALEQLQHEKAHHRARDKEIKNFAKYHGITVPFGRDEEYGFEEQTSYSTDWHGLVDAIERSTVFGEPFDLEAHRKRSTSTRWVKRKREFVEVEEPKLSLSERFGDDAPF